MREQCSRGGDKSAYLELLSQGHGALCKDGLSDCSFIALALAISKCLSPGLPSAARAFTLSALCGLSLHRRASTLRIK